MHIGLPKTFHDAMEADKEACDLLIVIGSSLKVSHYDLVVFFKKLTFFI